MKRLVIVILVAALAWSGAWFWQAHAQRNAIIRWAEDQAARGISVTWDDLAIRGFPNRLDSTFTRVVARDAQSGTEVEAPLLQVLSMVWNKDHVIAALPQGAKLARDGKTYTLDGDGIRASLVSDGDVIRRFHLEAAVLNLSGDTSAAMSEVTGAITLAEDATAYHVAFNAGDFALSAPAGPGALRLDAMIRVAEGAPTRSITLKDMTGIRLTRLELEQDALTLAAAGDVDVGADGVLSGEISVRADNLSDALATERAAGRLAPGELLALEQAVSLFSGLSGRDDSIDVTFEFRGGKTWVGILPLGPAPRLR